MTTQLRDALDAYARDVSRLANAESTTEPSYYPAIKSLIEAALRELELPLDVRASTSEVRRSGGRDAPDFAVYDGAGGFVMMYVEVKDVGVDVRELANSFDNNDQIGRYVAATGAVLLSTVREFAIVTAGPRRRERRISAPARQIGGIVELWPTVHQLRDGAPIPTQRGVELAELLEDALTRHTPIASPETLARVLARQARRAMQSLPEQFTSAVSSLRDDFANGLGISFDGEEGEHFFRSSLIQTVYYGLFAGWLLHSNEWRPTPGDDYDWRRTGEYLRIPFLAGLFHEIQHPVRLRQLGLLQPLETAAATLKRVDKPEFFRRLAPITMSGGDEASSAIVYFYEPFLAAFDPRLREELGVWYTPPEIVRYQVRRADQLLKLELGIPRGLADDNIVVLDPACGTGAYLIETLRCVAETLRQEGVGDELAATLRAALERRVFGFEILTAPFVVAHLQLYLLLAELGAPPSEAHRAGVILTNALTDWSLSEQVPLHLPELQEEQDAARAVKRDGRIVVVIGNPPYNRFAAAPVREEESLVDPYKGVRRDDRGRPIGQSRLWTQWHVRKQLLDDLYIRFFRLAEERIGIRAEFGIVSFISNSSFLSGRSHPLMRESLLGSFDAVWIDNLHGNRLANERTPSGDSCETVFKTEAGAAGIKVGTAVTTWMKRPGHVRAPTQTAVFYRDFWGTAALKREALVQSLDFQTWPEEARAAASQRVEGPRVYAQIHTDASRRWKLLPYDIVGGYDDWPSIDQLFPISSAGVNGNRGLDGTVMDVDRNSLAQRMRRYFSNASNADLFAEFPALAKAYAGYDAATVRRKLTEESAYQETLIVPYVLFPLDGRSIYYESDCHWLNRPRPEIRSQLSDNEFLVVVNEIRRASETKPLLTTTAFDLHLFDVGAQGFFAEHDIRVEQALDVGEGVFERAANLNPAAWDTLAREWRLSGGLSGETAKQLARQLFRLCLAVGHSPAFQRDYAGSLAHDWLHVPIPRDYAAFHRSVDAGRQVGLLLDPFAPADQVRDTLASILRDSLPRLAVLTTTDGRPANDEDLRIDIGHFGAAPGGWRPRAPVTGEPWRQEWGESTGDLYLNSRVFLRHVPERAWRFELGGYQVIKKWLGYREARRRAGRALALTEKDHLRSMVQRLTALATLEPTLDADYETAAASPFTAQELGLH